MKVVFDTNVLIAAFIARGQCADVYEHVYVHYTIFVSRQIITELETNLSKKFSYTHSEAQSVVQFVRDHAEYKEFIPKLKRTISRDRDDDGILALAFMVDADVIITGDKDLLDLKVFKGISIIRPVDFWQFQGVPI